MGQDAPPGREELLDGVFDAVVTCDADRAVELARAAVSQGVEADVVASEGVAAGLEAVARLYERRERYLVDLFNGGRVADAVLVALAPELAVARAERPARGTVVVGLIAPNVQDVGKRLVALLLRAHGYDVVDLGSNVPPERFAAASDDADAIAVTVMTDAGAASLARLVDLLGAGHLLDGRLVMCGGAAATDDLAARLGIRRGEDATAAVALVQEHMAARGSDPRPRAIRPSS